MGLMHASPTYVSTFVNFSSLRNRATIIPMTANVKGSQYDWRHSPNPPTMPAITGPMTLPMVMRPMIMPMANPCSAFCTDVDAMPSTHGQMIDDPTPWSERSQYEDGYADQHQAATSEHVGQSARNSRSIGRTSISAPVKSVPIVRAGMPRLATMAMVRRSIWLSFDLSKKLSNSLTAKRSTGLMLDNFKRQDHFSWRWWDVCHKKLTQSWGSAKFWKGCPRYDFLFRFC